VSAQTGATLSLAVRWGQDTGEATENLVAEAAADTKRQIEAVGALLAGLGENNTEIGAILECYDSESDDAQSRMWSRAIAILGIAIATHHYEETIE